MAKLLHRLFLVAACMSSLGTVGAGVLWYRSYRRFDFFDFFTREKWQHFVHSTDGVLEYWGRPSPDAEPAVRQRPQRFVDVRHRTVVAATMVLPTAYAVVGLARWRRKRTVSKRLGESRCPACGYDLRGGHDRCPECGAVTSQRKDAAERRGDEAPE
jgi:hypothetical protein